ncbi:sigma-70 family RNA polymerase sigma factor [Candidatus Poribacteria bacterium]|nr:sigma-70 family RNA polymerase sigma factor [Candidatus Poribacteria bacterium]
MSTAFSAAMEPMAFIGDDHSIGEHDYLNDSHFASQLATAVKRVCVKAGRPELVEDALQEAWAVCVKMRRDFDPTKGVSFLAFVRPHVRWTALHYCKSNSGAFSIPDRMWRNRRHRDGDDLSSAIYTMPLIDEDPAGNETFDRLSQIPDGDLVGGVHAGGSPREWPLWRQFDYEHLNSLVARLDPNELRIVRKFADGSGCADIAREIGVTRQRVHQVLKRALSKLRAWWDEPSAA